jgi:hypothetical protein
VHPPLAFGYQPLAQSVALTSGITLPVLEVTQPPPVVDKEKPGAHPANFGVGMLRNAVEAIPASVEHCPQSIAQLEQVSEAAQIASPQLGTPASAPGEVDTPASVTEFPVPREPAGSLLPDDECDAPHDKANANDASVIAPRILDAPMHQTLACSHR